MITYLLMTKSAIVQKIEKKVATSEYYIWTIGTAENIEERKSFYDKHGEKLDYWSVWRANSESEAGEIEQIFTGKGMKNVHEDLKKGCIVYVF